MQAGKSKMLMLMTGDDFDKVDAWYSSHVPSDFKASRMKFSGQGLATYEKTDGQNSSTVIIKSGKDAAGAAATTITLVTKESP